jgi:hypothetical protein
MTARKTSDISSKNEDGKMSQEVKRKERKGHTDDDK